MNCTIIDWTDRPQPWRDELQGGAFHVNMSLIFNHLMREGDGAELHRHSYAEIFVIRRGTVRFTDGETSVIACAGQIVIVGPNVPHAFRAIGNEPVEMLDIHDSGFFDTEWLVPSGRPHPKQGVEV